MLCHFRPRLKMLVIAVLSVSCVGEVYSWPVEMARHPVAIVKLIATLRFKAEKAHLLTKAFALWALPAWVSEGASVISLE